MPETYVAMLRRHVAGLRRMSAAIGVADNPLERDACTLEQLAAILDDVTPGSVRDLELDLTVLAARDELCVGTVQCEGALQALARGPARDEAAR